MLHSKMKASAETGRGEGLAKTLLLIDASPGEATLQLKCPHGSLKALACQAAGRMFQTLENRSLPGTPEPEDPGNMNLHLR